MADLKLAPLKAFIKSAQFDKRIKEELGESYPDALEKAKHRLYEEASIDFFSYILGIDVPINVTATEELRDNTTDGIDSLVVTISVFEITSKLNGFFKCPSCGDIVKI